MANFVGFNIENLTNSIKGIDTAYGELENVLYAQMQQNFINVMAGKWACKEAIEFFTALKEDVDDLLAKSYTTFQSVNNAMNSAGAAWDETTHSGIYAKVNFDYSTKTVDISAIKENIDGGRGIDPDAANESNTLKGFLTSIDAALSKAQAAVQECGFLGGETAATLQNSIASIKTSAQNVCNELITACDAQMKATLEKYGNLSSAVTSNLQV